MAGTQDSFTILSPAGYVMDIGFVAPLNGTGTFGPVIVTQPILGSIPFRGVGEHPLAAGEFSGRQGTMEVSFTAGAAGSARALAFLAASPSLLLGIAIDSSNRPYAVLINNAGAVVGLSLANDVLLAGTPAVAFLEWNSAGALASGRRGAFEVNESIDDWATNPVANWTPFAPSSLQIGMANTSLALLDFNGTIGKVQISNQISFLSIPGALTHDSHGNAALAGSSSMGATATVVLDATSTMAGASAVSADGELLP